MYIKYHVMYFGYLLEINSNSAGWLLSIPNSFLPSHHLPHLGETKGNTLMPDFASIPVHMVRFFYRVCRALVVKINGGSKFYVSYLLFSYLFYLAWTMYVNVPTPAFQWPQNSPSLIFHVPQYSRNLHWERTSLEERISKCQDLEIYNLELGVLGSKSSFLAIM